MPIHLTLDSFLSGNERSKGIKQIDKVEKLIIRLKGLGWRHLALLGFILVVDLLDLTAIDTQVTWRQDLAPHFVSQPQEQWLGCLLRLQGEGQIDHLGQVKESFRKAETIWVQMGLDGCLS